MQNSKPPTPVSRPTLAPCPVPWCQEHHRSALSLTHRADIGHVTVHGDEQLTVALAFTESLPAPSARPGSPAGSPGEVPGMTTVGPAVTLHWSDLPGDGTGQAGPDGLDLKPVEALDLAQLLIAAYVRLDGTGQENGR
ncbi:hypothetical protein [Actinomadura macrotermitis]|uniref:Uncharacterized protein n=1 Tax=Actinomadura macrotermitis TaxID=2585200 RepID=A0A7K0BSJ3_9ACTN|nr:hypothetical protein [Actinomadura macrotermitis]MQY04149.1 hypothetical protein [Actinomadura macrotermitis]